MTTKKPSNFLLTTTFVITFLAVGGIGTLGYFLFEGGSGDAQKDVIIQRGTSIAGVAQQLSREGIITRPGMFKMLLKITNGEYRVRAGEFRFREGMSLLDALFVLYHGDPIVHAVTIPEGWRILQIADALESAGLVESRKFSEYALNPATARKYKLEGPSLEGFLFPDTYHFSKVDGVERITDAMVKRFLAKFTEEYETRARQMGFSRLELITLASIIEKETGTAAERELVSSVFHNRLKKRMRLQSDPTTIYGIKNFDGNLTKAHLQEKTPYNTYRIPALPPGPIANPGWAAIQAALNPADTDYLYFVSNNQGGHIFAKTYAEHNRNVDRYQRNARYRRRSASNGSR